jgi:tetratricopeptide (TPR) repeat protein
MNTHETLGQPSPGAIEALYATGHWLYTQERVADAQNVFRALIHVAPNDERGWLALGACHELHGEQDIAFELYDMASSVVEAPRCGIARARILRARGLEREARQALDEVARLAASLHDDELRHLVELERRRS